MFYFQRRINVISTVIHNVEITVIRRWKVGWVVTMKKLILRNILSATLLTKWNLQIFFKDYAKTFTITVLMNFFWWLFLRNHLLLLISISSGLQQVSAKKCSINRYLVWLNKRFLWITKQQYWRSQDLPSALVLMDSVFSKLGSFKLPCYLPISGNSYKIIMTWITFWDCQDASANFLFFT